MRCPVPEDFDQPRRGVVPAQATPVAALLLSALVLWFSPAGAQAAGKDPTLPPAAWLAMQQSTLPGAQTALPGGDTSSLRLVLIGKTRRLALIDGQVVKPGDTHNGAKVVGIGRGRVLMQEKEKSLKLTPGVEKKKVSGRTPKQPRRIIVGGKPADNEKQTGNRSSQ